MAYQMAMLVARVSNRTMPSTSQLLNSKPLIEAMQLEKKLSNSMDLELLLIRGMSLLTLKCKLNKLYKRSDNS
jgi:hypothetical protein